MNPPHTEPNSFRITTNKEYHIFAGRAGSRQALIGLLYPRLIGVFFDLNGNFVTLQERALSAEAEHTGSGGVFDEEFAQRLQPEVLSWQQELGFQPTAINVKEFFLPNYSIGLESPATYWDPILRELHHYPQLEPEDIREMIARWDRTGQFVLWWGNDYYVDR